MKEIFKALLPTCSILLVVISFVACDRDFSIIESDVIGQDNANFETPDLIIPVKAYNKKLDSVQTSNLTSTLLGVYNDPLYGQTKASFVTQLTQAVSNPDFGINPVIDSVVLTIPYYSTLIETQINTDGTTKNIYKLDSLYGNTESPIKLSIYQNNYFLRSFNPNTSFDESQRYYSNANNADKTINSAITENVTIDFDTHKGSLIYENSAFIPSNEEIVLTTTNDDDEVETSEILAPSYRIHLDNSFWKTTILDKEGTSVLSNDSNFKDYFRGLYFKVEPISENGNLISLDLANSGATIVIYYSEDLSETDPTKYQSTYTLNFTGNKINTFVNDFDLMTLNNGNKAEGDEQLYLKNVGSMAVVDLFPGEDLNNNGFPDDLDALKAELKNANGDQNVLINEAQLIIYEDIDSPSEDHSYDRLYAYDIKNNTPLVDYTNDQTTDGTTPVFSKYIHLGLRNEEGEDSGIWKYKIRITDHLNNLVFNDSTNTKIGLVISNNVNYTNNAFILNSEDEVTAIPAASIISPRGTILYGSHNNVETDKQIALKLFFTKPK
ncbi:hypothetical protein APS56_12045 [Pseudalgibacter alginicilyticus]|uniref:DUF4270 domain-containing protein n=1 Tax=Pseudalgibacter alginicilyticus TaxID=1736674 RepID=A0A0P0CYY1_9FLAO|nr:DUF4270 domain-containing protein [Pseudalgibacter alginicilyticus]ALJ05813.1 hypothetical protein APS56_12045 [Pseudalgibacter alginicilyticus]